MVKWHEHAEVDTSVIISSRVRLARNIAAYPFPARLGVAEAATAIEEMRTAVFKSKVAEDDLIFCDLSQLTTDRLKELGERRVISYAMVNKTTLRGLIYNDEEYISILLNEEDHLRIQTVFPGHGLDEAYDAAANLDDIIAQSLEYAFDMEFGFLTSCPTNTGTGMRASYMLHIPLLESTGTLKSYADLITKAGFAIRGTHGEGSETMGAIYQISNQITLGRSEEETISALKHLANQIVEKEFSLRHRVLNDYLHETQDSVHRAYGILTNCRKIGINEAMRLLSDIRLGNILGLLDCRAQGGTIYNLMTNILPYSLQKIMGRSAKDNRQLDVLRAEYLRSSIS